MTVTASLSFDSDRVLMIRARLGMTQKEFADFLDISVATVQGWERGLYKPARGKMLGKLLAAEEKANVRGQS